MHQHPEQVAGVSTCRTHLSGAALAALSEKSTKRVGRFTYTSKHARKRIWQRVGLTLGQVIQMIERGLGVHIGMAPASNREHLAIYSPVDDQVFVAVRNKLTGIIITVWPLEYHRNLAWDVAAADVAKAKRRFEEWSAEQERAEKKRKTQATGQTGSNELTAQLAASAQVASYIVKASYQESGSYRTKVLFKESSTGYADINDFVARSASIDGLEDVARDRGVDPRSIVLLSIQLGNKGDRILIPIDR
jgi:hypothetical protein